MLFHRIKSIFKKIFSIAFNFLKKIGIKEAFTIVFLATFFLVIAAILNPERFAAAYYSDYIQNKRYSFIFDIFVRNGGLKIPYFLFSSLLFAFLVRGVVIRKVTKNITRLRSFSFLVFGFVISLVIYHYPPYYVPDFSTVDLDSLQFVAASVEQLAERDEEGIDYTATTTDSTQFCGKRIDYIFQPYYGVSRKGFSIVKELESEVSIPVNYHCLATFLNEDRLCDKNHGVPASETSAKLVKEWLPRLSTPTLVLGCKYGYRGVYTVDVYKHLICEKLDHCL